MEIEHKNQNNNKFEDIMDLFEIDYVYENKPIKRTFNETNLEDKQSLLENLKKKVLNISDCELKKNSNQIVFSDGDPGSAIMIIGEGPGQKEDEMGKPFVGDAGILLNKMLEAINIKRSKVYITNVVNYRPPNNRKPEPSEINRYSLFLREHINIINPKILILMGSTAMEALFGQNLKISKERGKWKELIVNQKTYLTILTFHPAYLLRQPDQKKFTWADLKMIRKKIDDLKIII
tara:strand:- start:1043 stop:1747 length:705 start_codon:yes stop_codon:yes gene_type:complete